jgi:MYXO-CTERM domain-containing protein
MRIALAALLVAALAGAAGANGRDPFASTIHFRPGNEQHIVAGMTFGLISSKDGGATWHWYCEQAVGYGGTYDPDYVYTASGAVFATTFEGLRVMRDDCSFTATPPGATFVSRVERGPDGAIYFAAADQNDTKIYKSTDDGVTFPTSAMPGMAGDWWQAILVARSDASRVYLTGYRLPMRCTSNSTNPGDPCTKQADCPGGACEPIKEFLLFKSTDGGASYQPMQMTGISPTSVNSAIELVGVHPTDPDVVYVRVTLENTTAGESIYKSTNAGTSWTKILSATSDFGGLSFLVRNDGTCVAGTRDKGSWKSSTCEPDSWTELTGAPHVGCLYENSANEVWVCTQNTASPQLGITSDGFGIMKSTDLTTWTGVLRFQNIQGPVSCPQGTVQQDECIDRTPERQSQWCCLITQLGITSMAVDCTGYMACFGVAPDVTADLTGPPEPPNGCCEVGSGPPAFLVLLVAAGLLFRRRSPKES